VDEFRATQEQARGPGMSGWWDRVIPQLTDEQAASLSAAADDPTIAHRTISVVLGRWGHPVSPGMVGHWRRNVR
jgi:hypothetical protein